MPQTGDTGETTAEFYSGRTISAPGDSIFDDIFDWIQNAVNSITATVTSWIRDAWSAITSTVTSWVSWSVDTMKGWWQNVLEWVQSTQQWVSSVYSLLSSWVSGAWQTVSSAVTSAITTVYQWIDQGTTTVLSWVTSELGSLRTYVSTAVSSIPPLLAQISANISDSFAWLTTWMKANIVEPLASWFDTFVSRILDFPRWIGKLFDAVAAWFSVDIPGHSPRWLAIIEDGLRATGNWLYNAYFNWFPQAMNAVGRGAGAVANWIMTALTPLVGGFIDGLFGFVEHLGPIAPSMAGTNYKSLMTIGFTALAGLGGMTIIGDLLHPLKVLGFANISAMLYDICNYKLISQAFVGALTGALIAIPARWYYYDLLRPQLPSIREGSDFYASDDIDIGAYSKLLGYHGIPDDWHKAYADSAYRPPSPYQLTVAASSGVVDIKVMLAELRRAGFHPDVRKMYRDVFNKLQTADVKAGSTGGVMTRYQEGFIDDTEFASEMAMLRVAEEQIPVYLAVAKLNYATDYIRDLISAWQTAVRSGNMTLDEYRANLTSTGMVPQRTDGYIQRELARQTVKEPRAVSITIAVTRYKEGLTTRDQFRDELMLLGCPAAELERNISASDLSYAYDYTGDLITAYRDAVRSGNIDLSEYRQALLGLNMVPERVEGYVLIERARLKPKEALTPLSPPAAEYTTDAGKIKVDTIRRNRRKGVITRDQEIAQLLTIGMDNDYAAAVASNDDARLGESAGGAG